MYAIEERVPQETENAGLATWHISAPKHNH